MEVRHICPEPMPNSGFGVKRGQRGALADFLPRLARQDEKIEAVDDQ